MMRRSQEYDRASFSTIDHKVRRQLNVTNDEYILLDTVYHLSAKYGYCYASTTALADIVGLSFNGMKKMIQRMKDRELLTTHLRGLVCTSAYSDIAYLQSDGTTYETAPSAKSELSAVSRGGKLHSVQSTALSVGNKDIYINTKSKKTVSNEVPERLIAYWNKVHGTTSKVLPKRISKINDRLKHFTGDEIAQAITNAHTDPFFMGSKGWKGDLDYLIRDDVIIDKYVNYKPVQKSKYA
jgi:hypothetical protein